MTTKTRPETIDQHGTIRRHGCPADTFTTTPTSLPGWTLIRCTHCGTARLTHPTKENPR